MNTHPFTVASSILLVAASLTGRDASALLNDPYANGAAGLIVKQFDFAPAKFAEHPTLPLVYASVPATNSVAVIDTLAMSLVDNVFIGNKPGGLSVSPDGSRLYVSTGSDFISVMDTTTNTKLDGINIGAPSIDVEARSNDNLVALITGNYIGRGVYSVTPSTGAYDYVREPGTANGVGSSQGEFAMSPDRQTLYYGNFGSSPSSLYRLDFVSPTEAERHNISPGGGNGQDVGLSRNGELLAYAVGGGNDYAYPYDIAVMRTSDQAILGSFNTGAYPREIEFAPDAGFAYTVNGSKQVKVWSTETFLQVDTFDIDGNERYEEANELYAEKHGRYLFAPTNEGRLLVYSTGRNVPVPMPGDLDGDGDTDDTDLGAAISNFTGPGGSGKTIAQGDTDGDGDVDDTDLGVMISGFTGPLAPPAVPEPATGALALLGLAALSRRRRC